jgi:Ca2+-binding EF-hand superfamily protein
MKITQAATLSIIVLVTALISGSAYAMSCGGTAHTHSAQEMAEKYFSQMDANDDGLVSKSEFNASAMTKFVQSFAALKPNAAGFVEKKSFLKMFVEAHSTDKPEA